MLPWQETADGFLEADRDEVSDRHIYWIYSIKGEMGKSSFVKIMVEKKGALVIENAKPSDIKHLIKQKVDASDEDDSFAENPIIFIDLSRTDSQTASKSSFYTLLESICGTFASTKYEGGIVTWDKPPRIMIFANFRPNPSMMSPDRIQAYIISNETLDLVRDTVVDAQLKEIRETLEQEQVMPPTLACRRFP